ncbi:MAG: hypothetical protein KDJ35_02455 [Alphaproteobacteria bacterium]|nr:hypothetical protein [Alphaproteobacteria bacterium]
MPKEDRRIIFNNEEIYKAIFALCSQKQIKKPPPGRITALKVDDSDDSNLIVTIENPHDAEDSIHQREYSRDFLAAALMLFCRGLGIPLPKGARKSVLIKDDQVMLRVQIG